MTKVYHPQIADYFFINQKFNKKLGLEKVADIKDLAWFW